MSEPKRGSCAARRQASRTITTSVHAQTMTINLTRSNALTAIASPVALQALEASSNSPDKGGGGGRVQAFVADEELAAGEATKQQQVNREHASDADQSTDTSSRSDTTDSSDTRDTRDRSGSKTQLKQRPEAASAMEVGQREIAWRRVTAPAPELLYGATSSVVRERVSEALLLTKSARSQQRRCVMLALLVSSFCLVGCAPAWRRLATAAPTLASPAPHVKSAPEAEHRPAPVVAAAAGARDSGNDGAKPATLSNRQPPAAGPKLAKLSEGELGLLAQLAYAELVESEDEDANSDSGVEFGVEEDDSDTSRAQLADLSLQDTHRPAVYLRAFLESPSADGSVSSR